MGHLLKLLFPFQYFSFQNEFGEPNIVEKATILPPQSKMGTIDDSTRQLVINSSIIRGKYDTLIDDESAYEVISDLKQQEERAKQEAIEQKEKEKHEKEQKKELEKKKKEEERARKNSASYKLGKKVTNKAVDKAVNKGLNSLFKSVFK